MPQSYCVPPLKILAGSAPASGEARGRAIRGRPGSKVMPPRRKNDTKATPSLDPREGKDRGFLPEHRRGNTTRRGHLQGGDGTRRAPMSKGFRPAVPPTTHRTGRRHHHSYTMGA